ncbi:MAG: recombinase family protein [Kaiparowitsia implicata GSE-PSE-MK54-09C]|nr:recombinase family protein [Kaiparowitsia implicata GSE-PSE-MK54-09C]
MKSAVYIYTNLTLESVPDASEWGDGPVEWYQDRGDRTQWQQLLADAPHLAITHVWLRHLADLGTSLVEVQGRLAQLEAQGMTWAVWPHQADGAIGDRQSEPHNTPAAEHDKAALDLSLQQLQQIHQLQQEQRSRRIQEGHAQNRIQALPPPGKAPYGYRRGSDRYLIDRTTAPIIKDFFEHFLLYGSLRGSVRHLQQTYNKTISVSTGKRWLTSPVYRGDLQYHTGDVLRDTHAALMTRQEAAQIDRLLRRNRRLAPRSASAPRSLAGLAVCQTCQSPMTVSRVTAPRRSQDYLYLRPTQCPLKPKCAAIAYDAILQATIERICQDLPRAVGSSETALNQSRPMPDLDAIKQSITQTIGQKQQIIDQLPTLVEQGILDNATADLRTYTLRSEIARLETQLAELPPVNLRAIAQVASLPQFWLDLSESERRFYFREFIRQIQLVRSETGWAIALDFIF